jgi:hypothetical protein
MTFVSGRRFVYQSDHDEGFTLIQALLVERGYSAYTEIWSDQPPGFVYLAWGFTKVFGREPETARLLVILLVALMLSALADQVLREVRRYAPAARRVVTSSQIYAYRLDLEVPPGLAVTSSKRFASGDLARGKLARLVPEARSSSMLRSVTTEDSIRLAIARFNEANGRDPNKILAQGAKRPRELLFAERLEAWIYKLTPNPSPALRLAARCQHLCRFEKPRSTYPEGRIAYLKWRKDLAHFHAAQAESLMAAAGVEQSVRAQVRAIQLKQELKQNPDSQTMEDALCLSFLEFELEEFAERHPDEKVIDILQKSWRKMSEKAHGLALVLSFEGRTLDLVRRATSGGAS